MSAIRAAAVEELGEALIADRRFDDALAVLEPHIVEHPHRDRPRGLAIRALAASGRQTEALRAFRRYRDELAETAGTEPSAELRAIDQRVATGWDGFDDRGSAGAQRPADPAPRHVTPPLHEVLGAVPTGVGRRGELTLLAEAAEQARHLGVRTVLVSGGAGIGKTTLLATFAREASGWDVFYGRCDEHVVVPFHPFQSVVGRVVDTLPSDVLMAHTAACGGDLLRLVPHVAGRIALSVPAGDDDTARHRMFNAVFDVIERAAAIAPLILVLDDLHWAEPAALQLLRYLVHNLGASPGPVRPRVPRARRAHHRACRRRAAEAARIELHGLDVDELAALVHERLDRHRLPRRRAGRCPALRRDGRQPALRRAPAPTLDRDQPDRRSTTAWRHRYPRSLWSCRRHCATSSGIASPPSARRPSRCSPPRRCSACSSTSGC